VVVDALSHRPCPALNFLLELPIYLYEQFPKLEINVDTRGTKPIWYAIEAQPTLIKEIRVAQTTNPQLQQIRKEILVGKMPRFVTHEEGNIRFCNRVCIQVAEELKKNILDEDHNTPHSIHPGGNKLYKDLMQTF